MHSNKQTVVVFFKDLALEALNTQESMNKEYLRMEPILYN